MPTKAEMAGKWRASGSQANVPNSGWTAEITLTASGAASLRMQQGLYLNKRSGSWTIQGTTFELHYTAPKVGPVEWTAQNASATSMAGSYRTPKAGPAGVGWGGNWSATKVG